MLKEKKSNILTYSLIAIVAIFPLFFVSFFAYAQIPAFENIISLEVVPKNPRPGQLITVRAQSFSIDLDRASKITWLLNDTVIERGVGIKEVKFNAGKLGSRSIIDIIVESVERGTITETVTIRPTEVDILWEAKSYVPQFYKGKALPASDAEIIIVAIPQFVNSNGRKLSSNELIFTWKKDGKVLGRESGRGKNTIKIKGPKIFSQSGIQADVISVDNTLQGRGYAVISAISPKIIFYENDAVFGIKYENAIKDIFTLLNEEVTITAHPYFFSSNGRLSPDFDYSWKVDGSSFDGSPDDNSSIVLRQVGEGEGMAKIAFSIQNINRILQSAQASFSIIFGRANKDAPFSF